MLHQPAFIPFHSLRSFRSSFTQSLSQPHSSIPVWQPGYCHLTFFRLAGRFLSHILRYSDRQARKSYSRNPSDHPGKLLKPPHFLLATGVWYLYAHLLPVGHKRKPRRAVSVSHIIYPALSLLFLDSYPSSIYSPAIHCLFFKGIAVSFILPHAALIIHVLPSIQKPHPHSCIWSLHIYCLRSDYF
jgi:hypothetical protein